MGDAHFIVQFQISQMSLDHGIITGITPFIQHVIEQEEIRKNRGKRLLVFGQRDGVRHDVIIQTDLALIRLVQADQQFCKRRFTAAVAAGQKDRFSAPELCIDRADTKAVLILRICLIVKGELVDVKRLPCQPL